MIKKRIQSILMLLTFTIFAEAAGIEIISPDKILSSPQTGAATPADLILDGDAETAWQLTAGETDGWAELGFDNAYLFYGIYIEGQITPGTTLNIEYSSNGIWTPFISGILFSLSSSRQFINLSYDMAVSKSIRLHLRGANASESSIKEVSVIGKPQGDILHRLKLVEVKASDNTSDFYPASNLFDGNTYTLWKSGWSYENRGWDYDEDDWNRCRELRENKWYGKRHKHERRFARHRDTEIEAECELDSVYTLEKIKLFYDDDSKGDVKIEYETRGRWMQAVVIRDSGIKGWHEVSFTGMNISTSKVRITMERRGREIGGLGELEIYGYGSYKGNTFSSLIDQPKTGDLPINLQFSLEGTKDTLLQFLYKENIQAQLAIEINGKEIELSPIRTVFGNTLYAKAIEEESLWEGMNFLRIKPNTSQVTLLAAEYGEDKKDDRNRERIGNGFITPQDSHTGQFIINLGEKVLLESIEIFSANPRGQSILANVNGEWTVISPASYGTYDTTYSPDGISTDALTIGNSLSEPIENIRVTGSPITDHAPDVRIIWPLDGDDISLADAHTKKLLGFVDNPDTVVKVNDRKVKKIGHYFWTELDHLGILKDNPFVITAEATDKIDRKGSHSITVFYGESPLFTLDQKDEIIYTSGATIKISGTVRLHDATVTVNGLNADVKRNKFAVNVPLEYGLNILKATCVSKHGNFTRTIIRKAVRLESDLSLTITSSQDQSYTNQATTTVRGTVEGVGKITVTVNGTQATINGNTFESKPVTLAEGTNTITAIAKNQYGSTITKQITITKDTIAPAISDIIPAAGTIIASSSVAVSVSAQDSSPLWVYANGKVCTLDNGRYATTLASTDGTHTITVKAKDAAGNSSTQTITVITDTTPPLPFEVTANPSDWTANTQPVVTFGTTDVTSGINRYELSVDEGAYSIVTSLHTLDPLLDGEHTVTVKAIDNAGWEAIATTKVYIDTIAPFAPEEFELVPGNEQIRLNWKDINLDVTSYRITRYLPWEETNVWNMNIEDTVLENEDRTYSDHSLLNGIEYRYSIIAIDRAGNESESTVILASICGVEKEQNVSETEIIAKYEGATLYIQPGGLHAETAQVVITQVESEEIDASMTYGRISPIFSFTQEDTDGTTVLDGSTLPKNFIGAIDYDPAFLPEGYEENNIGVYYFNALWDRWFLIEPTLIDKQNHRAYFLSHHFTLYTVQPTAVQDLTPQEYQDAGYSSLKTYAQHESITVSPQGGSVSTGMTELILPGPGGFDLKITRRYNTATATMDARMKTALPQNLYPYLLNQGDFTYRMGDGWRLDLPYVMNANIDMYVCIPGGGFYSISNLEKDEAESIERDDYKYMVMENHEDIHFTLIIELSKKTYTYEDTQYYPYKTSTNMITTWKGAKYTLTLSDGTIFEMDGTGRTKKITDPEGLNSINIIYKESDYKIDYIEDSLKRKVYVGYTTIGGFPYITSLSVRDSTGAPGTDPYNRSITYTIDDTTDAAQGKIKGTLRKAADAGEREWLYTYDPNMVMEGPVYPPPIDFDEARKIFPSYRALQDAWIRLQNTTLYHKVPVLKTLRGPGKGIISIDYMLAGTTYYEQRWIVANNVSVYNLSENFSAERPVRITDYNYTYSAFEKTQSENKQEAYVSETRETDGERETIYSFGAVEKTKRLWTLEEATPTPAPGPHETPVPTEEPGTPGPTIPGETPLPTIDGTPDPYNTPPADYEQPTQTPSSIKNYEIVSEDGDPKSEVETRINKVERKAKGSDIALETILFTYPEDNPATSKDESKGKSPYKIRNEHGANYMEETYTYDAWGNTTEKITETRAHDGVNERKNKLIVRQQYIGNGDALDQTAPWKPYSSGLSFEIPALTRARHNLPLAKMVQNYIPIDDPFGNFTTIFDNMQVSYEYTYYEYNSLGQLKRQAQWDSSKPGGKEWLVTLLEYDSETQGGNDFGNLIKKMNPEGHITNYEYDTNGYMKKTIEMNVKAADGNATNISTEVSTDRMSGWILWQKTPRGYVTEYMYDSLGRILEITQPSDNDSPSYVPGTGRPSNPKILVEYGDEANNLFAEVTDEEGNATRYSYNELGQLVTITRYKDLSKTQAVNISLTYNRWGETSSKTDANGNTTFYQYDSMGRQNKIIYPDDTPGQGDNPFKFLDYDYELDKLSIKDERGNVSWEYYDRNNKILRKEQQNVNVEGGNETIQAFFYYDSIGNTIMSEGPKPGTRTISTYNSLNFLTRLQSPEDSFLENPSDAQTVLISPVVTYEYNKAGYRTKEIREAPGEEQRIIEYTVDGLGRVIVTSNINKSGNEIETLKRSFTYFDGVDNIVKTIDANNVDKTTGQRYSTYTYSARNLKLSESDNAGNTTTYEYYANGKIKKLTAPQGNAGIYGDPINFSIFYFYDNLGMLDYAKLPPKIAGGSQETIDFEYDNRGALVKQTYPDTSEEIYTYTPRGWIFSQTRKDGGQAGKSYTSTYEYDLSGNRTGVIDQAGNKTSNEYDSFGRLIKTTKPEGNTEKYGYDEAGNKIFAVDGNGNKSITQFNKYNKPLTIKSQLATTENPTISYFYDRLGNKTKEVNALGHTRKYEYDKLGRLINETDEIGGVYHFDLDSVGNVTGTRDPNGTQGVYTYTDNYLLSSITLTALNQNKNITYAYDEEGTIKQTIDDGVEVKYNYNDEGVYTPDAYKRIFNKQTTVEGKTLVTRFEYDKGERITGITYPNTKTISYEYSTIGELTGMPGYINEGTIQYNANGLLSGFTAANDILTSFDYDKNNRLTNMTYGTAKQYDFTYDNANNIIKRNENNYQYDAQNQLIGAYLKGQFGTDTDKTAKTVSIVRDDHFGRKSFEQTIPGTTIIELDYAAGSIGIDLGASYAVTKIELAPDTFPNRVEPDAIRVFASDSNLINSYNEAAGLQASYVAKNGKTLLEIRLGQPVMARYIKIKTNYDDRNLEFIAANKSEFKGNADSIIKVYYNTTSRDEAYAIDATGNRTNATVSTEGSGSTYRYYPGSDRLMTDGKSAYLYDANGNTVKKGDHVIIEGVATQVKDVAPIYWDSITSSISGLEIAETGNYTSYIYDLLNRLVRVERSGQTAAEYVYEESGLMVKKTAGTSTTYYAWSSNGTKIYEETGPALGDRTYMQYAYLGGRLFAYEKGTIGIEPTLRYYTLTDQVGSVTAITDASGVKVWECEITPYGMLSDPENLPPDGMYVFAGHWYDYEVGLFYAKARFYMAETGRFITVDPIKDMINWYAYAGANPITYSDPSGYFITSLFTGGATWWLDLILWGGAVGGYVGGAWANNWQMDPTKWRNPDTWLGVLKGALIGGGIVGTFLSAAGLIPSISGLNINVSIDVNQSGEIIVSVDLSAAIDKYIEGIRDIFAKYDSGVETYTKEDIQYIFTDKSNVDDFISAFNEDGVYIFSTSVIGLGAHPGALVVYTDQQGRKSFYAMEIIGDNPDFTDVLLGASGIYWGYNLRQYGGEFGTRSRSEAEMWGKWGDDYTFTSMKTGSTVKGSFNDFFNRLKYSPGTPGVGDPGGEIIFYKTMAGNANYSSIISSMKATGIEWESHHPRYSAVFGGGPNSNTFLHYAIYNALGPGYWKHIPRHFAGSFGD